MMDTIVLFALFSVDTPIHCLEIYFKANIVRAATVKTGNLKVHFSRRGKHREFAKNIKIIRIATCQGNVRGKRNFLQVREFGKNVREFWPFD